MSVRSDYLLPEVITLNSYGGNIKNYLESLCQLYDKQFNKDGLYYDGQKLIIRNHIYVDWMPRTFYHITHTKPNGCNEDERIPDMARCERLCWVKPILENHARWGLKKWSERSNGKTRVNIWLDLEDEPGYFIVIELGKKRHTLVTAYVIETSRNRHVKERAYREAVTDGRAIA